MKVILQSEPAECGIACIAMVASCHGQAQTLPEMRRRFPTSLKGARLSVLMSVAERLGLRPRALRIELDELKFLSTPSILHWDMNHFVVLEKAQRRFVDVVDPSSGKRRLSWKEVSEKFTGVALELIPGHDFAQKKAAPEVHFSALMGPIRGLWSALATMLTLSLMLQLLTLIAPFYLQWVVDKALVSSDLALLNVLGVAFSFSVVVQAGISWLRGFSVVQLSSSMSVQWMSDVFAHMLKLPLDFFERRHLGDITSRISSIQTIQTTLTAGFVEAVIDGFMAAITLALMFAYSAKLAAISVLATSLYLLIRTAAFRKVKALKERHLLASATQQTHLLETVRGMQSLKVAGKESFRRAAHDNLVVKATNLENVLARAGLAFSSCSQLIFGIERVIVIWIGAALAMRATFSVGMLIAYLAYKEQFVQRASSLIEKAYDFRMLRLHATRLSDIVLAEPDLASTRIESDLEHDPSSTAMTIEVSGLYFRYSESEPWVVENCSFSIAAGESVAIVGQSGCGKTTLIKLLLGVLRPANGTIKVAGVSMHGPDASRVRSLVGAVMQEDQLFAGTIAQNIGFFDPDFSQDRVEAAAKMAAIHDEISIMPMGYESLIGDMGSALSGGQKQRVILARALYSIPSVLFLDEATSHLDVAREREVSGAIRELSLTRVIVAHRPETIASVDRVLTMEAGRITKLSPPVAAIAIESM